MWKQLVVLGITLSTADVAMEDAAWDGSVDGAQALGSSGADRDDFGRALAECHTKMQLVDLLRER